MISSDVMNVFIRDFMLFMIVIMKMMELIVVVIDGLVMNVLLLIMFVKLVSV